MAPEPLPALVADQFGRPDVIVQWWLCKDAVAADAAAVLAKMIDAVRGLSSKAAA